jgi:hypothetical protein
VFLTSWNEMLWQKYYTTYTMHAVSLPNLMDLLFSRKFSENFVRFCENFANTKIFAQRKFAIFCENRPIFAWFLHFRKNWKMHLRFNPSCTPFPKYSTSLIFSLFSSIFVFPRKCELKIFVSNLMVNGFYHYYYVLFIHPNCNAI